eukprot:GSChrysophyteH1.ASY1.ANO1.2337.1 assembled CDS
MEIIREVPALFVKQTRRGCFQELLGCEATSEFNIATPDDENLNILYALEDSSFCIRLLCPQIHPWRFNVSVNKSSDPFLHVDRPLRCINAPLKCCCFQEVTALSPAGSELGSVKEDTCFCVPTFSVISSEGLVTHRISMSSCVGGMCINCCDGCQTCSVPFYIHPVNKDGSTDRKVTDGHIIKKWSGAVSEIMTDADNFELKFPSEADENLKASLLGAVFMINQLFFEKQN